MKFVIYSPDGAKSYSISAGHTCRIWISKEDGEGMDTDAERFNNMLFAAIDKYYEENF